MTNPNALIEQISKLRKRLEDLQKERRATRLQAMKDVEEKAQRVGALNGFELAADVRFLMERLRYRVACDVARYNAEITPVPPTNVMMSPPVQELAISLAGVLKPLAPAVPSDEKEPLVARYVQLFEAEMEVLVATQSTDRANAANALLITKLKQVQQALTAGRLSDARTLLRNLLRAEPHNQTNSYLLSQLEYLQVGMGQQNSLPEARDQAQRSMNSSERVAAEHLWRYKYEAIVSELAHNPERAMEELRNSGLLAPALLQTEAGLAANGGLPLLSWLVLSEIPSRLWQESDVELMADLIRHVSGGAVLYGALFRAPLLEEMALRKQLMPHVGVLESTVQLSCLLHEHIVQYVPQLLGERREPSWLVKIRYGQALLNVMPMPTCDQVLLQMSLDGQKWLKNYPNRALQEQLDDPTLFYWKLWASSLTHVREHRQTHLLPFDEMLADVPLAALVEELLQELRTLETERMFPDMWEDLQPFMARWSMDHLLAAGTGSNQPRTRFSPTLLPYSTLYGRWSTPMQAVLASDIILEVAKRGGFASWFEVLAAMEGATRLLDDPNYGLKRNQKNALFMAKQQDPAKFGAMGMDDGSGSGLPMMLVLLVMVGGVLAALLLADNWGQAAGMLLVSFGLGGVMLIKVAKAI